MPYLETCLQTFVYKMKKSTARSEGSLKDGSFRLVASWFFQAFGKPRNKQLEAWPTPQKAEKETEALFFSKVKEDRPSKPLSKFVRIPSNEESKIKNLKTVFILCLTQIRDLNRMKWSNLNASRNYKLPSFRASLETFRRDMMKAHITSFVPPLSFVFWTALHARGRHRHTKKRM